MRVYSCTLISDTIVICHLDITLQGVGLHVKSSGIHLLITGNYWGGFVTWQGVKEYWILIQCIVVSSQVTMSPQALVIQ